MTAEEHAQVLAMVGQMAALRYHLGVAVDLADHGLVNTYPTVVDSWRRALESSAPEALDGSEAARLRSELESARIGAVRAGARVARLCARVAELEAALDAAGCDDCRADCEDCEVA